MPSETATHWTVSVSKETDETVRTFLAQHGRDDRDLSDFIEEAVKWRMLDQTIAEARDQLSGIPPGDLLTLLDEAVVAAGPGTTGPRR